jgi:hypothetical protein
MYKDEFCKVRDISYLPLRYPDSWGFLIFNSAHDRVIDSSSLPRMNHISGSALLRLHKHDSEDRGN